MNQKKKIEQVPEKKKYEERKNKSRTKPEGTMHLTRLKLIGQSTTNFNDRSCNQLNKLNEMFAQLASRCGGREPTNMLTGHHRTLACVEYIYLPCFEQDSIKAFTLSLTLLHAS
jgi:hypothetical protein